MKRNILTESASIRLNNQSKQNLVNNENGIGSWNENKTTKSLLMNTKNNQNSTIKLRARSAKKSALQPCTWCIKKSILEYILPTLAAENLQFCSEKCITEFRKTVRKGACKLCGNAVKLTGTSDKEYCHNCMQYEITRVFNWNDYLAVS